MTISTIKNDKKEEQIFMINKEALVNDVNLIRKNSPLVHNITNFVVMNNTANALLALGASPVMAHSIDEVEDMVNIASSLVINIGTLQKSWVRSMIQAGKSALKLKTPVILDPVGAGATPYRIKTSMQIMKDCKPSVIRGNASEISSLIYSSDKTKGVDSTLESDSALTAAKALSKQTGAVIVVSGSTDYIVKDKLVEPVKNGHIMMTKVTGLGCTATAIVGAFCAVNPNYFEAATHAMCIMGIAGERAAAKSHGPGSLQLNFLDELYNLKEDEIVQAIKQ
jgi:hydroxyethylthiazole kinase